MGWAPEGQLEPTGPQRTGRSSSMEVENQNGQVVEHQHHAVPEQTVVVQATYDPTTMQVRPSYA